MMEKIDEIKVDFIQQNKWMVLLTSAKNIY